MLPKCYMDEHQSNDDSEKYFKFKRVHSGFLYSCLVRRIWECIPKLYYSSNFPDVSSLQIGVVSDVDESVNGIRDIYAKKAMLMFYPFKRKEDLYGCHDSLWDSLQEQNQKMIYGMTTDTTGYMLYIHYSIQNLQNIQDMLNVKKIPSNKDTLFSYTDIHDHDCENTSDCNKNDRDLVVEHS